MSLDTNNSHVWIHNMDLFYGKRVVLPTRAKGDGTVDIKGDSKYVTVAYNRFWDNGKASMCGMKSETGETGLLIITTGSTIQTLVWLAFVP